MKTLELAIKKSGNRKEQEPEGVTAEEMLDSKFGYTNSSITDSQRLALLILRPKIIEAMESYAKSKQINRRDELKRFMEFIEDEYGIGAVSLTQKQIITEYLKR